MADVQQLFEAAHKDPHLKSRLLSEPAKVAAEWSVDLDERAVDRLSKLGAFVELANEVAQGSFFRCDPRVCYPVDVWLRNEAVQLVRRLIFYHIYYPAPHLRVAEQRINENLRLHRELRK